MKTRHWAMTLFALLAPLAPAAAQNTGADGPAAPSHGNPAAEAFIADNISKGLAILNNAALSEQQHNDQFQVLLLRMTDAKRVSLFTLGDSQKRLPGGPGCLRRCLPELFGDGLPVPISANSPAKPSP